MADLIMTSSSDITRVVQAGKLNFEKKAKKAQK